MGIRRTRFFALAALLALAACAAPQNGGSGGSPSTPPPVVHGTAIGARSGVATGGWFIWESDAEMAKDLKAIADTGAKWIRIDFDWNSVQNDGRSSFRWDRAQDRAVSQARAYGLNVLGVLAYSPAWARQSACAGSRFCLPANPADYAAFARAAAARYGSTSAVAGLRGTVPAWEIWNEPNHYPFVQPTVDVAAYTAMLKQAYPAIKAADPNATVVTGGTAPAPDDPNGRDVSPVSFLEGIYAHGGRGSFDAVGHHPYSFPYSPLGGQSWNAFTQTKTLHDHMAAHGDGNKRIWGTEAGAPTGTASGMSVSEATQAQYVHDYFKGWNQDFGSFTGPLFWFQHRDSGTDPGNWDQNFGLLRHDWSEKPAYAAFRQEASS